LGWIERVSRYRRFTQSTNRYPSSLDFYSIKNNILSVSKTLVLASAVLSFETLFLGKPEGTHLNALLPKRAMEMTGRNTAATRTETSLLEEGDILLAL